MQFISICGICMSNFIYLELESQSEVAQSCPTFCDPMDCSLPAPPCMGFSRQEYWSGLPFPSPGDLPDPGFEPWSPALQADTLPSELPGKSPVAQMSHHACQISFIWNQTLYYFPGGSDGKASAYSAGDLGSNPGSGGSPGEGNDNPLQYSCLENPMHGGAWQATVHGVAESQT